MAILDFSHTVLWTVVVADGILVGRTERRITREIRRRTRVAGALNRYRTAAFSPERHHLAGLHRLEVIPLE